MTNSWPPSDHRDSRAGASGGDGEKRTARPNNNRRQNRVWDQRLSRSRPLPPSNDENSRAEARMSVKIARQRIEPCCGEFAGQLLPTRVRKAGRIQPSSMHSRLIVDSRSSDASFDTKADAPAPRNAWLMAGSAIAVNMITFVVGFTRLISRHASND